jgi:NAD+ kinase
MTKAKTQSIRRIFVVYKRSVYQKYILDEGNQRMSQLIHRAHVSAATLVSAHEKHMASLNEVLTLLDKTEIPYDTETRNNLREIQGYDLILTIGGDGTFLYSAHQVTDQLIMGINSAPDVSVGALCSVKHDQFPKKLAAILAGKYQVKTLPRLKLTLNSHPISTEAINDVLFTNVSPAATSRYLLKVGKKWEEHKSSGIWMATSTGSTAAISAAGGTRLPSGDTHFQYLVREPYQGIYSPYKLTKGILSQRQSITIINKMVEAKIFIDGPRDFINLNYGDELTFSVSPNKLRVII